MPVVKLFAMLFVGTAIFVGGAMSGAGPVIAQGIHVVTVAGQAVGRVGHALAGVTHPDPPQVFENCTQLNRRYPHGIARAGAHDRVRTGRPVTKFHVSTALYRANRRHLDRDNDGVACEHR